MSRVVILLMAAALIWPGCKHHGEKAKYARFVTDFIALKNTQGEKIKAISTQEHYLKYRSEKKKELEKLLKNHHVAWTLAEPKLLKCKILLELNQLDDAAKLLDAVEKERPDLELQTRQLRIQHLLYGGHSEDALKLLQLHEEKLGAALNDPGEELWSIYTWLALHATNPAIRLQYAEKYLGARDLPYELQLCRSEVYRFMAQWNLAHNDPLKSRDFLEKAISAAGDLRKRDMLENQRQGYELLGKPAPPIYADRWLNPTALGVKPPADASALSPLLLKDRPLLLCLWARNSRPSQHMLHQLQAFHSRYLAKGLTIIALTRLHGLESIEAVENLPGPENEIKGILDFITKHNFAFPVAVDIQGSFSSFLKISAVPTLLLTNKRGEWVFFTSGADDGQMLETKIKQILEVQ